MRDQAGSNARPEASTGSDRRRSLALVAGLVLLVAGTNWWIGRSDESGDSGGIAAEAAEPAVDSTALALATGGVAPSSTATSTQSEAPSTTPTTITSSSTPSETSPEPGEVALVYFNDFSAGELGPEWERYDSVGNAGWGLRRPSALSIVSEPGATAGGRCLLITAAMGAGDEAGLLVSGGAKLLGFAQTYGRYTLRMRVDDDPDQVTSGVALLWPTSNEWPRDGEINIIENYYNRSTRTPVESRLHWLSPDAEPPFDRVDDDLNAVELGVDATEWHTYVLEWRSDLVTIAVDGQQPISLSGGAARIPQWDMDLTLQLDAHDAPDTGTQPVMDGEVTMCIDYVKVERL